MSGASTAGPGTVVSEESRPAAPAPVPDRRTPVGLSTIAVGVVVAVAVAVGLAMRAWFLFHQPVNADEAIVGLMAKQILHGHVSAFYWGQSYGGGEPYLVAVLFAVFGTSSWALEAVSVLFSVAAAVLTWRIVRQVVDDRALAVLAGAAVWVFPKSYVASTTLELGFRGLTMACGLGLVLLALHIERGAHRWPVCAALGLVAGVGWWSSPEIVYFLVPAGLLVLRAIVIDREAGRARQWVVNLVAAALAAVVGSLPWLWANAHSRFASLRTGAFNVPPGSPGYTGRLKIFFQYSAPMVFNLRNQGTGAWLWGRSVSLALLAVLVLVVVAALVLCVLRGGSSLILAVSVVVFPLLVALSPATWYWEDGRYDVFVVPLLVVVVVVGCAEAARRMPRARHGRRAGVALGRTLAGGFLALALVTGIANFALFVQPLDTFTTGWTNPNGPTLHAIGDLEAHGVHLGYADYWVAYRLDLLSDGRLQITTAGADPDRWLGLDTQVRRSPSTTWLFVPVTTAGVTQFAETTAIQGPAGITEPQFLSDLHRLGIGYRVVDTGLVRGVTPARPVTPTEIGLPRPAEPG